MTAMAISRLPSAADLWASLACRFDAYLDLVADARVNRGIMRMDKAETASHTRIKPDALNIGNPSTCALAQVFGDYYEGRRALKMLPFQRGFRYGFHATSLVSNDRLNAAWRRRLVAA